MSTLVMNAKPPRKITGRMVLFGFIAFFGVIAAVNGVFMYLALSTWPGLTTEDAYKKGIAYNHTLDEAAQQKKLGWVSAVKLDADGGLQVTMTARDGSPLDGANVEAALSRPLGDETVEKMALSETAPGQYAARFPAPQPGRWKADIFVTRNKDLYRMRHEVMVK
jgi:nitrogen fixation protein FixH